MLFRNKKNHDIHKGKWNGLGGKLHQGETPEDCVRREVEEESGYLIGSLDYKGLIVFPEFDSVEDWYVFVFRSDDFTGEMRDSDEGELSWIDDSKIFELPLWEGDYIFMKWLENTGSFSAQFIYKSRRLADYKVVFYGNH